MEHTVSAEIIQLLSSNHLLTAPELVEKFHAKGRTVNKTSVYRALEKLEVEGVVCKQNLKDNELVYELRENHHDHLVCMNCGKVIAAECQVTINNPVKDFTIDHHHLTIFGTCSDCQTKL